MSLNHFQRQGLLDTQTLQRKNIHQFHLLASIRSSDRPEELMSPSQEVPVLKEWYNETQMYTAQWTSFLPLLLGSNRKGTFKIVTHSDRWKSPRSSDRSKFG